MEMTLEERRNRLRTWLDCIYSNVTEAVINQHIFWEVQDIIRDNPQLQNASSAFYVWMGSMFVHSTVLAVRRQLDTDKKSISLHRLLLELSKYPELISRDYHRSLYSQLAKEFADDMATYTYDKNVGVDATTLDPAAVQQEIDSLKSASEKLHHYADRVVAHYDACGLQQPTPKFEELTECLSLMEKLVLRYLLLLKGASQEKLLPTFLYDWKEVFRTPWIVGE
jgi:hypothetical protein